MFGYVRTMDSELKVKEHELYKATYCGLCRSMGEVCGGSSRLTLSYDGVFLSLLRTIVCLSGHERLCLGVSYGRIV